jgi:hypothetical protein
MNEGLFISSRAWIEATRVFMNGDGRIFHAVGTHHFSAKILRTVNLNKK